LDSSRILYKASGRFPDRPIQATVKQVIGGMFSGYHQHLQSLEDLVIQMLYSAAKNWTEKPLKSRQANYLTLRRQANAIITPLRFIMDGYLTPYLKAITTVLFNTDTDLRWGQYTNNCQNFCDAILQQPVFSTVFPTADHLYRLRKDRNTALLDYVVSFRTESQLGNALQSTRLSPGPLTAFLKLLHRQTNVLEYQEEHGRKGNKNAPLCAETFAWRCHDEDCDLADHIWTNPAEFVSILQFHLMLDKNHYLQASENEWDAVPLSEKEWVKNRLAILQAIDSFATAAAAISRTFQNRLEGNERPSWNPPRAPSIPQDMPFMMAGDTIQYVQEDPGPGATSFFGKWFSRASSYQADVELPKAYGPNATAAIVTSLDTNEG